MAACVVRQIAHPQPRDDRNVARTSFTWWRTDTSEIDPSARKTPPGQRRGPQEHAKTKPLRPPPKRYPRIPRLSRADGLLLGADIALLQASPVQQPSVRTASISQLHLVPIFRKSIDHLPYPSKNPIHIFIMDINVRVTFTASRSKREFVFQTDRHDP